MSQSLSPVCPVGPHYLGYLQPPQVPATPPSKAPAQQPFPNTGNLRMCLGRKTAVGMAARAATDFA